MKGIRNRLWPLCFSLALIAFTVYISLDTFVISRSYDTDAVGMNTAMFDNLAAAENEKKAEGSAATAEARQEGVDPSVRAATPQPDEASSDSPERDVYSSRSVPERRSNHGFGPSGGRSARGNQAPSGSESDSASGADPSAAYTDDTAYQDGNVAITLTTYEQNNTKIYVADVTVTSAQYLKTAFANNTYGKNVTATTSSIAQANNAILAVNGDYYGAREAGYVIRNGIVYRGTATGSDVLCVYADGTMKIVNDREFTADQLVEKGVWQAFSFGPALVEDGSVTVGVRTEVGRGMASNPRTAIGVIDANHYVFVVSDGRTDESEGLTLYELAQFMQGLGVQTAYNLDGGGSSTLYFNGRVVNNPTTTGRIQERSVSDIVYIGKDS